VGVSLCESDVDEAKKNELKDLLLAYDRTLLVAGPWGEPCLGLSSRWACAAPRACGVCSDGSSSGYFTSRVPARPSVR
jgi:hypothetical protein